MNPNISKKKSPRLKGSTQQSLTFYALISPFLVMLVVLKVVPFVWGIAMSLTNYTGFNIDSLRFIGFANYARVFSDKTAYSSLLTTLAIGLITVPSTLIISLTLALLLNKDFAGVGVFRTIYYFPSIIPAVATGVMWKIIFMQNGGVLNVLLGKMGLPPVNWLGMQNARKSLIIYILWGAGGGILTYLAALKGISRELYEAASMDGAGPVRQLFKITLPMLSPVIFFNLVNGLIAAWQLFFQPIFLQEAAGGAIKGLLAVPPPPNYTFMVHIYQQIFVSQRFGYGLAMIWVIFFLSILLTRITFYTSKYWVYSENDPEQNKPSLLKRIKERRASK